MKPTRIAAVVLGISAIGLAGTCYAQEPDLGKMEYENSCAICHGKKGEGDGPYGNYVTTKMPNLATLAKQNNGVFPFQRVYDFIDGRQMVKAHGERDMPIWGRRYMPTATQYNVADPDFNNPNALVRARVLALTEYVFRLQLK